MTDPIKPPQELYAFNVTWHGGQDDPMFTVRANTVEEFRERCALILEGWEAAQPVAPEPEQAPANVTPMTAATPPAVTGNVPVCPVCGGETLFKTGNKKDGTPWQGWLCRKGYKVCKGAVWV